MVNYNDVVIGFIERFKINASNIDELCYEFYALFKDDAISVAIERPSCSRIVIIGKDFEVRVYISPNGEGTLATFINTKNNIQTVAGNFKRFLISLNKILLSLANIVEEPTIILRMIIAPKLESAAHVLQAFRDLGMVVETIDKKFINDFNVTIIKGFYIGKNLRKHQTTVSMITNERTEIGITIESKVHLETLYRDNVLHELIVELYNVLTYFEKSLTSKE
ncbi:MAG: hypothetical protein QXT53_06500 [Ignisphaera sp.]